MNKSKWLFANGRECKNPISSAMRYLNSCQNGTNILTFADILVKNSDNYSGVNELLLMLS